MAITLKISDKEYSDLDLNFMIHPVKKDINKVKGEYAVIAAVKNLLMTNHYERHFQPEIGSNIRGLLFDQLDNVTASDLEREIELVIKNFEPRVTIISISVSPDIDNNAFAVSMEFFITNKTESITINFLLERVR
jgi:phage baseplate assembly protein W